jgi:negative regulator of flagellin synthesis FlgM
MTLLKSRTVAADTLSRRNQYQRPERPVPITGSHSKTDEVHISPMTGINPVHAQNISRTYVQNADATQGAAAAKPHKHHQSEPKTDSVSLSDSARSLASARQAVQDAPDVRDQKVADIKQRVQDGTYDVPSRVLARKLLGNQQQ